MLNDDSLRTNDGESWWPKMVNHVSSWDGNASSWSGKLVKHGWESIVDTGLLIFFAINHRWSRTQMCLTIWWWNIWLCPKSGPQVTGGFPATSEWSANWSVEGYHHGYGQHQANGELHQQADQLPQNPPATLRQALALEHGGPPAIAR